MIGCCKFYSTSLSSQNRKKLRRIIDHFGLMAIPEAVYNEAVRRGMALGKPEAQVINELIKDGRIKVEKVKKIWVKSRDCIEET